jgi:hypothetical protein
MEGSLAAKPGRFPLFDIPNANYGPLPWADQAPVTEFEYIRPRLNNYKNFFIFFVKALDTSAVNWISLGPACEKD